LDFTLAEIKRLDAGTWFDPKFAGERIPTWEEAVALVGTSAGLYPELKTPALYTSRGIDMTRIFADSLKTLRLSERPAGSLIVQSFDEGPLRTLAKEFHAIPRTLLIEPREGARWLSREGLAEVARFATGIGPSKSLLDGKPEIVSMAHAAGLTVTPYTFTTRGGATRFPTVRDEMRYYMAELEVDALFTDNPDLSPR
jgi:glycerophosphoryl diester phosphodiesterase